MDDEAKLCAALIREAECIVVLTGAGISTNAGIPDFRGPKGLYVTKKYDPDTVFDINAFHRDPKPFFEFARDFITFENKLKPTFTHEFLAKLESCANIKGVVTQNIDSLHHDVGSSRVVEMHGSFHNSHCLHCSKTYTYKEFKELVCAHDVASCVCGGIIKPDIVFFGENVKNLHEAAELAARSDLFFIIGSSCVVQPAAMLPEYTTGRVVVVNQGEIGLNLHNVALHIQEDIDQFFRKVAEHV